MKIDACDGSVTGEPDAVDAVTIQADGRTVRLKRLPLTRFGEHTFTLDAVEGTAGVVTGSLSFRAPRGKGTLVEAD